MNEKDEMKFRFTKDLAEKRIVYLCGEINSDMARDINQILVWLNVQSEIVPITLYVDSGGGDVRAGFGIHDAVRLSKAPIYGIIHQRAFSMAAVILQACTKRQARRYSEILIHNIKVNSYDLVKILEDPQKTLERSIKGQEEIYRILSERTGRTVEEVKKLCGEDRKLYPEEALGLGLIDEII